MDSGNVYERWARFNVPNEFLEALVHLEGVKESAAYFARCLRYYDERANGGVSLYVNIPDEALPETPRFQIFEETLGVKAFFDDSWSAAHEFELRVKQWKTLLLVRPEKKPSRVVTLREFMLDETTDVLAKDSAVKLEIGQTAVVCDQGNTVLEIERIDPQGLTVPLIMRLTATETSPVADAPEKRVESPAPPGQPLFETNTLLECVEYLGRRGLLLESGRNGGKWWVRLLSSKEQKQVALERGTDFLEALRAAITASLPLLPPSHPPEVSYQVRLRRTTVEEVTVETLATDPVSAVEKACADADDYFDANKDCTVNVEVVEVIRS